MDSKSKIQNLLFFVVLSILLVLFLRTFVLEISEVASDSMSPTLKKGDIIVISKLSYEIFSIDYNDPAVGDLIAFRYNDKNVIKRINKIEHTSNNSANYYVLGDNSKNSIDSREFGTIPGNKIYGKVILKFNKEELISFVR